MLDQLEQGLDLTVQASVDVAKGVMASLHKKGLAELTIDATKTAALR